MTTRTPLRLAAAGLLALGAAVACFSEHSTTGPTTAECSSPLPADTAGATVVRIRNFAFVPAEARVPVGSRVLWVNCEPVNTPGHTSTADAGAWSSPTMQPGQTFSQTFGAAGSFGYHCTPHPFMKATVIVQ